MRWIWYLLSANFAITAITLCQVWSTPAFTSKSITKRLQGIVALSLFGLFILVISILSLDWRKRNEKQ